MGTRILNRWQASGIHLLISLTIAAIVFSVMLAVWFPGPLFWADGGNRLLLILVSVDVTLGPLITLFVYRHGKRGMRFDLTVIALLQLTALVYGLHVVYYARPAFLVFAKDQFQIASVGEIAPAEFRKAKLPQFSHPPLGGPLLAYAVMPTDPKELAEVVNAAMSGRDVETMPKLFAPYAEHAHDVLQHAKTLAQLRKSDPAAAKVVDAYVARSGWKEDDVRTVRLMAATAWCAVIIDARTALPKKMLITERF